MNKKEKFNKPSLFNYVIIKNIHAKEKYHWICIASNGEIRCTSENYTQKQSATNAVINEIKYRLKGVCSYDDITEESIKIPSRIKKVLTGN